MITIVNKWYEKQGTKTGALNPCILGYYEDETKTRNTLPNCTAFVTGAFNYYHGQTYCKYFGDYNAYYYYTRGQQQGLQVGQVPVIGSVMVWSGGTHGNGHVAFVEKVNSSTSVYTAESGYVAGSDYSNKTRNKGTGNWGAGSNYTFLGFVYPPGMNKTTTKKKFPWVLLAERLRENK